MQEKGRRYKISKTFNCAHDSSANISDCVAPNLKKTKHITIHIGPNGIANDIDKVVKTVSQTYNDTRLCEKQAF